MKLSLKMGGHLPLMESFNTIQGEGYFSGSPAYFLRIGGCDVGCHWCDVKESWDFQLHPPTSVNKIIERISNYSIDTVVITGGAGAIGLSMSDALLRAGANLMIWSRKKESIDKAFDKIPNKYHHKCMGIAVDTSSAVSYTHLTLPTILLV